MLARLRLGFVSVSHCILCDILLLLHWKVARALTTRHASLRIRIGAATIARSFPFPWLQESEVGKCRYRILAAGVQESALVASCQSGFRHERLSCHAIVMQSFTSS